MFSLVHVGARYGSIWYCCVSGQELFDLGPMGFPWVIDEVINAATILSRLMWFPYGWMFMVLGHYWRSVPPDDVIIIQLPVPSG